MLNRVSPQILAGVSLILLFAPFFGGIVSAAVPNIPPAVMAQLQNMSPQEQAKLAKQYGIELPRTIASGTSEQENVIGQPGEIVDRFDRVQQLELESFLADQERAGVQTTDADEDQLKRFGLDFFDRRVSTFAPVDDMPAPDDYRIGAGDSLRVYMFGKEEMDVTLDVNREGVLFLPVLGPINVAGLAFDQVKDLINEKVASQLVGTKALVSMGKLRAINVFLAGDVYAPGSYSVSGLSTVMQVLYAGGGVRDTGSLRKVQVKRSGKVISTLDTYDILLRGDTSGDVRLRSGDTVFVTTVEKLVELDGEVKRPAIYEVLDSENLGDLLDMAGGITARGYEKSVSVARREPGSSSIIRIQYDLTNDDDLSSPTFDGDKILVAAIKEEVINQVTLRGAVARPGGYAWRDGLRISDLVGNLDDDLLIETDLSTGLVVRRTGVGLEIEALAFDLGEAIANPGSNDDLLLKQNDDVLVFVLPYLNQGYQELVEASRQDEDRLERDFEEGSDGQLVLSGQGEASEEEDQDERGFEERSALIDEVVFRLEAQAKSPSTTQVVEISGDVRLPGKYPLLEDRSVEALIDLAGGFESSAFLDSGEVTRISFDDSGSARISAFKINLLDRADSEGFMLQPLDQIRVSRIPNWSYGDSVELTGALVFPGSYAIVPGETLYSVLSRAGGIEKNGFPEGAVLIKREAKEREEQQLRQLIGSIRRGYLAKAQTRENEENASSEQEMAVELELLESILDDDSGGRVVIDLPAIMAGDPDADIQLEAGDSLFVPRFNSTVSVIGEVREPGTFQYERDLRISDYLDLAAGATVRADKKETYVVRANGSVERVDIQSSLLTFSSAKAGTLEAGDTIIVPVNEEYLPALSRYKEVSTVVFQSIASLYPLFRL